MDPYEYCLKKLKIIEFKINNRIYMWNLVSNGEKLILSYSDEENLHLACKYAYRSIFQYTGIIEDYDIDKYSRIWNNAKNILKNFPIILQSCEEVDLLITLNGLNREV